MRVRHEELLFPPNMPSGMNPFVLMSLAYMLRSGVTDPDPIEVRREGDYWRIVDGRHRAMGAMLAGRPDVLAVEVG